MAGGALGGLLGGAISGGVSKALQEDQQQFLTSFYKQRYQRQMADMRKAGLNPILSYRSGVPGTASAGIASSSAGQAAVAGSKAASQIGQATSAKSLLEEQKQTEISKQTTLLHQGRAAEADAKRTNVLKDLDATGLPKAQHQKNFYTSQGGKPAVTAQEVGKSAGAIIGPILRPR